MVPGCSVKSHLVKKKNVIYEEWIILGFRKSYFSNLINISVYVKVFLYIYAYLLAVIKHASMFVKFWHKSEVDQQAEPE